MELPGGYSARAPGFDDLEAIADVLAADGQTTIDAGFLGQQWSHPEFDPSRDAVVVVDAGQRIVAYAQVNAWEPAIVESWGTVHPAHRGRGLGSALLDELEARAARLLASAASGRFRHAIDANDGAAAAMLRARRLRPVRHFWHMEIDLAGVEAPVAADGIVIRRVDAPSELATVHTVLDEAFAQDWGYHPLALERWVEEHAGGPNYDPSLWGLAFDGVEPVAALTATLTEGRGWVDELGVRPSWRGRGIAAALLRRSFATFADRGVRRVILNVDAENPTGATRLYERVGMRIATRWDLWERGWGDGT